MRQRITWTIVVITALAVVILSVPLAVAVSGLYHDEVVQRLIDDAARAAAALPGPPLSAADPAELPATDDGASIAVFAPDGTRFAGAGPAVADAVTRDALSGHVTSASIGGEVIAAVPVGGQEQVTGAVRAAMPLAAVDDRVHRAWLIMSAFGVAAVAVAAAVALWQARRLGRPLKTLTQAAERLGSGDFSVQVASSNVAEIDSVARAMNVTAQRLAAVLDRERAFSADASHQLRTPLTALRLRLESALLTPGSDARQVISDSMQEIDRLEQTVDELLRLTRDVPADRGPLDIRRVLQDLESRWRQRLAASARPLVVTVSTPLPVLAVSESAVRQILDVLVDNAMRHGQGSVRVTARDVAGGVAIEVGDDGPGISGDTERVFQRRHTTSTGTGIGLALARSLAEAEGGRLMLLHTGPNPVFRLVLAGTDYTES